MARDFDSQLLESVAVRRRRLRDALLHGAMRTRRTTDENLRKAFAGVALAAVMCAGCVGWSFVSHRLAHQTQPGLVPITSSPAPASGSPR
jgi:type VI protein secretion system component VasF